MGKPRMHTDGTGGEEEGAVFPHFQIWWNDVASCRRAAIPATLIKNHAFPKELLTAKHAKHAKHAKWKILSVLFVFSAVTQAGFVRIVSNPAFSRDAVQPREAIQVHPANTTAPDHEFWPDELPMAETVAFAGVRLMGHPQVTDAYLLGLAIRRGGMLATLDQSIAALTEPTSSTGRKALETVG